MADRRGFVQLGAGVRTGPLPQHPELLGRQGTEPGAVQRSVWSTVYRFSPPAQRHKHFNHRHDWTRDINGTGYLDRINNMVSRWWEIGIVLPAIGPDDAADHGLPVGPYHVERGRSKFAGADPTLALAQVIEAPDAESAVAAAVESTPSDRQPRQRFGRGEV